MTISYNWLREYLPEEIELNPEELSSILTGIGLEVEGLRHHQSVPGGLEGLLIGKVEEVVMHPHADRLKLTKVNIGNEEPLSIVCGAPNVAQGQYVVVAPVGTTIYPVGHEPVTMKKAKIRGEESFGMICAEDEIGLGENHEGILVLEGEPQPGMKAGTYFEVENDWIYEIGLTPNRMDAMSHLGVAMDVCAKLSYDSGKSYTVRRASVADFSPEKKTVPLKVTIENKVACPRYAGLTLSDIKIAPSPKWMQRRLQAVGVRPINNVVDITNYVLQECGQPLHAFDMRAIKGKEIRVKNLPEGTVFVTLDEQKRQLRAEDLMICNKEEGMCIAGVFGGLYSGVKEDTTSIFLESAFFDAVSIRRTSLYHHLRTDAATHFEKGVDVSGVLYALKRAALLMKEYAGAVIGSEITDCYPQPREKKEIRLTQNYLQRLSGKAFSMHQASAILKDLGFEVEEKEGELLAKVPFAKADMTVAADLVEEIMRIDGYDNVEIPARITISPSASENEEAEKLKEKIGAYLSNNGFLEIMTNSITNSTYYEEKGSLIKLLNSLTSELDALRPSMLETGLEVVAYNLNRKQENLHLFELGTVYAKNETGKPVLALWLTGHKETEDWLDKGVDMDPFFIEGHFINLFRRLGIDRKRISFVPQKSDHLQSGTTLQIDRRPVGRLGLVTRQKLNSFGIKELVWYAELELSSFLNKKIKGAKITYKPIPKFPVVRRDLSLVLDRKTEYAQVEEVAKKAKSKILKEISLFDVYQGKRLPEDKKSYAVSFTFRHPEKTLTDKEIDKVMNELMKSFEQKLNAEIRS